MTPTFSIRLAKEDFKFSVAHLTIFGPALAEPLHGHNYRLALEVEGGEVDELGLLADCDRLKRAARAACAALDDKVLLPEASPHLAVGRSGGGQHAREGTLAVRFADREYRFPAAEVLLLPIANVTMELLAHWAWQRIARVARGGAVTSLMVEIEETPGQLCRYRAALAAATARPAAGRATRTKRS
ncbi:MAG: 6-carboxytetrahydropterin synthase [Thermoanaerobaculia bacterium]